jgi:putative hydrolase of HD superfamily
MLITRRCVTAEEAFKRDVEFIYEIGCLRLLQRMWSRFQTPDFANVAEHHFRVAWIALIIAEHEQGVDHGKLLKMALAHDIPESRAGDLDYVSRLYAERHEDKAMADMLDGTALAPEIVDLWLDYENLASIEAKIVKDADYIDVDAELAEQRARGNTGIYEFKEPIRQHVGATKLKTETGKKLWAAVRAGNPYDWIAGSKNRLNTGDWKPKS